MSVVANVAGALSGDAAAIAVNRLVPYLTGMSISRANRKYLSKYPVQVGGLEQLTITKQRRRKKKGGKGKKPKQPKKPTGNGKPFSGGATKQNLNIGTNYKMGKRKGSRKNYSLTTSLYPKTKMCKMKSVHLVQLNGGASSGVASLVMNLNNPLDPIDTTSSIGETVISTEHHPKYWDLLEGVYDKFQVISAKITFESLSGGSDTFPSAYALVSCSTENTSECLAIVADTVTFATRLKEAYPRAQVMFYASTAESTHHVRMTGKVNIARLEGIKDKNDVDTLQGTTSKSATEAAPTRTPKMIFAHGPIRGSADLTTEDVVVTIEQVILFLGRSDVEGVTVA